MHKYINYKTEFGTGLSLISSVLPYWYQVRFLCTTITNLAKICMHFVLIYSKKKTMGYLTQCLS